MKIQLIASVLFLTGIFLMSPAQARPDSVTLTPGRIDRPAISFDLTTPFAVFNPRYKLGFYLPRNNNFQASLQLGFGHESINPYMPVQQWYRARHDEFDKYRFFEICPEIRFYSSNVYIAYNLLLQYKKQRYYDGSYIYPFFFDLRNRAYDQADYASTRLGINAIAGYAPCFWNKVGFDIYAGFGIRLLYNDHFNVQENEYVIRQYAWRYKTCWDYFRMSYYLAGGLKIIYVL